MNNSIFGTLNLKDFLKGLVVAVLTAVIGIISTSLQAGSLTFDWKQIGTIALSAGLAYIGKNLFSNSQGTFAAKEPTS